MILDLNTIKITKLSYKKIQLDYQIPISIMDPSNTFLKPINHIDLTLRYQISNDKYRRHKDEYFLIGGELVKKLAALCRLNNIGKLNTLHGGDYVQSGLEVKYGAFVNIVTDNKKIVLAKLPETILVHDLKYVIALRDKRLQTIFE